MTECDFVKFQTDANSFIVKAACDSVLLFANIVAILIWKFESACFFRQVSLWYLRQQNEDWIELQTEVRVLGGDGISHSTDRTTDLNRSVLDCSGRVLALFGWTSNSLLGVSYTWKRPQVSYFIFDNAPSILGYSAGFDCTYQNAVYLTPNIQMYINNVSFKANYFLTTYHKFSLQHCRALQKFGHLKL